jgi:hypothetical protein
VSKPPGTPHRNDAANRVARVTELVAAAGEQLVLSSADKRAIRNCTAEPTVIAEAIAAAARREWGDEWLRQNLSARLVIQRLSGYLASRKARSDQVDRRSAPTRRPSNEERAGPARTAYAFEGPWGPDRPPRISSADLERMTGEASS